MTQLTYTFIRIQVGAEKYWEEVKGFVSGDKKSLFFKIKDYDWNLYRAGKDDFEICENDNHPLSKLANKLGATLYGGFEDEKDFHLMMPTVEGFKVGDYDFDSILSIYAFNKYKMYGEENARFGFHILQLSRFNEDGNCSAYEIDFDDVSGLTNKPYKNMEPEIQDLLKKILLLKSIYPPKIKNIFQEYARTGIIENDLYKHFFK